MRPLCLAVICAALALGGCGGGDSDTGSSVTTASTTATAPAATTRTSASAPRASQQGAGAGLRGGRKGGSPPSAPKAVKPPPISSAPVAGTKAPAPGVKTVKGADDSVQTYGVEADESARTEAATALQAYLNARVEEDWGRLCSYFAQQAKEQLEKFDESPKGQGLSGCAETMKALSQGTPQSQLREEATITEVLSLRGGGDISGDPSYLIFTGPPGSTLYSMPMYLQAGAWKVGLAQPSELPL
jgi:hypothetical protein